MGKVILNEAGGGLLGVPGGIDGAVVLLPAVKALDALPSLRPLVEAIAGAVPVLVVSQSLPRPEDETGGDAVVSESTFEDFGKGIHHLRLDIGQLRAGLAAYAGLLRQHRIVQPLFWVCDPLWFPFVERAYSKLCVYHVNAQLAEASDAAGEDYAADGWLGRILERYADGCVVDGPETEKRLLHAWPILRHVIHEEKLAGPGVAALDGWLGTLLRNAVRYPHKLEIAMLCAPQGLIINTIREYVESFLNYSRHNIKVIGAPHPLARRRTKYDGVEIEYNSFDVIIVHYSARVCVDGYIDKDVEKAIETFAGYKILFIQDEYTSTEGARKWIERMGIHLVYSVVPQPHIEKVYPRERYPFTEFKSILTGYVPIALERGFNVRPLSDRPHRIVYRGNLLPFHYGDLAREKAEIGIRMKAICQERGLSEDIEWEPGKKIHGSDWYNFLQSGRATLATESGTNIFDIDGDLKKQVDAYLKENPDATYEDVHEALLKPHEEALGFKMNQISPKVFEFIGARTALILFPGDYSGVVQPHVHYIPLEKDFSNVDEVLARLEDLDYLEQMTKRAFDDVIASGKYTYKSFVHDVDADLDARVKGSTAWGLGDDGIFMLDQALSFREHLATSGEEVSVRQDNLELDLLIQRNAWKRKLEAAEGRTEHIRERFFNVRDSAFKYRERIVELQEKYDEISNAQRAKIDEQQEKIASLNETIRDNAAKAREKLLELKEKYEVANKALREKVLDQHERFVELRKKHDELAKKSFGFRK